jgi:hypothetical protein
MSIRKKGAKWKDIKTEHTKNILDLLVDLQVPSYEMSPSFDYPVWSSEVVTEVITETTVFLRPSSSTHANVSG